MAYFCRFQSFKLIGYAERENGYVDVLLLKRPHATTKYTFILELKYLKKGDENRKDAVTGEPYVQKTAREAREQLQKYLQSENAKRMTNLKAWLIILVGREWHLVEAIV